SGFDVAVARAFADDAGLALRFERFAWPALARDVAAARFTVAMSGVTVRPERSVVGRFSVPVARSGAVVLARPAAAAGGLDGLDRPEVRIAVNAGGHLERAARRRFARASLQPLSENDAVRRALASGAVDAIVTDTLEAPHWERTLPGTVRLGPFTRDRKAYLWSLPASEAERLDAWLLAREADGTLARLRERWLGAPGPATATPFGALVAALGERLSLMPLVAEAKRGAGRAVRDRAREARVLEAARADVARHARAAGAAAPPPERVEAFYRAQIEAAVAIQERSLAGPPAPGPRFDLGGELRPALLRIGDRIAWALVRLDAAPSRTEARAALAAELEPYAIDAAHGDALADALLRLAQSRASTRASSPAITGSTSDAP
ncbi:MAG TPA: transporter substrate-binding domain-containing protein, partial [Myxococcota bacterium]|nr:transporter substrate-binding domain-containing protein [Myxococcota bacterium]